MPKSKAPRKKVKKPHIHQMRFHAYYDKFDQRYHPYDRRRWPKVGIFKCAQCPHIEVRNITHAGINQEYEG